MPSFEDFYYGNGGQSVAPKKEPSFEDFYFNKQASVVRPKQKSRREQLDELMVSARLPRIGMWGNTGQGERRAATIEAAGGVGPYLQQMFSGENLAATGNNLIESVKNFLPGMGRMIGDLATIGPKLVARATGLNAPGVPPPTEPGKEGGLIEGLRQDIKPAIDVAMFVPNLMKEWAADPAKAMRERGLDTILALVGGKVGLKIKGLARNWQSGFLSDADFTRAVRETIGELPPDWNAKTALVHQASKIEPGTDFKVSNKGVATPMVPGRTSRSAAQAGLDSLTPGVAKTTVGESLSSVAPPRIPAEPLPIEPNIQGPDTGRLSMATAEGNLGPIVDMTYGGKLTKPPSAISTAEGELGPLGLGLKTVGHESMSPAQRAAYDKLMAQRKQQYYKPGARVAPPSPSPIEPTTGARIIQSKQDAPIPGRTYVVSPKPGEAPIPERTNSQGRVTLWKHEADAVRAIKDRRVGVKETSIYWMEREPILRDGLWHPQKAAEASRGAMIKDAINNVDTWKKTAPNQERIGAYLISQQKGGPETLKLMGMESPPVLTPQEMLIVKEIRAKYDGWLADINEARAIYGNDPITGVDSYSPMLRNPKMLEELGFDIVKEPNVDILKAHLSAPPLRYLQERTRAILPAELKAYDIYRNYVIQTSKYVAEAPVMSKARAISGILRESGNAEGIRTAVTLWADHLSGQRAPDFIRSPTYRKVVNFLNRNISRAALDLNIRSAAIQPTSLVGAYSLLGNKFMLEGLWDNANPAKRAFAVSKSDVLSTRNFDVNVTDITTPISRGGKIRRGISEAISKVSNIAIAPLKLGDYESAQTTWLAAQRHGSSPREQGGLGMSPEESYRYADEIVVKTQGSGHPSDIAEIQRSTTGKVLTIFQTFTINNWNMLKDIFGGGTERPTKQRVGQISRLLMAVAATNVLFEDVLGIRSPFPAPEHAIIKGIKEKKGAKEIITEAAKELAEVYPPFGGTIRYANRWKGPLPASAQVAWESPGAITRILGMGNPTERDFETLGKLLGVPGASQGRKVWTAVKNGKSLKEAIFGAKEYTKKKRTTASEEGW